MTPGTRQLVRGVTAVLALSTVGACAGQGNTENGNAEAAGLRFSQSIEADPARACDLLAPGTRKAIEDAEGPCPGALSGHLESASGPAESTEVYGKNAIVRLSSDTIFLARFADGWRVTAAGCTRQPDGRPYDCTIKGD